jgi:stage V sporulation protein SpoVS
VAAVVVAREAVRAAARLTRVIKAVKVIAVARAVPSKAVRVMVSPNSTSIKIRTRTRIEIRKVVVAREAVRATSLVSRKRHPQHPPWLSKNWKSSYHYKTITIAATMMVAAIGYSKFRSNFVVDKKTAAI